MRKSKRKILEKSFEKYESRLDIMNIVDGYLGLARLTNILFSKDQRLLFRHQNDQAIVQDHTGKLASKPPSLTPIKSPAKRLAAFNQIQSFSVSSEIDKRLVLGLFKDVPKKPQPTQVISHLRPNCSLESDFVSDLNVSHNF